MLTLHNILQGRLSFRLSLRVVAAVGVLLVASMLVMLHYSRKSIREETLYKAAHTLDATVMHIDNILLSVEQTTGNIFFGLMPHLDSREAVSIYCRKLVESNPYVTGCAIAFAPDHYEAGENFMAYFHRDSNGCISELPDFAGGSYTQQAWFTESMTNFMPRWMMPLGNDEVMPEALITFCLPIFEMPKGTAHPPASPSAWKPIGIIGVDVSLALLSEIVNAAKPSANSYSMLLADDGSFIVHPDTSRLTHGRGTSVSALSDQSSSVRQAAEAMLSGKEGYSAFTMKGREYYVFYKPFQRIRARGQWNDSLGWSVGIVYPKDDIFGDYSTLLTYVIVIAVAGLLLLFFLCRTIFHRQLQPLLMLSEAAQHIAQGNYDDTVPHTGQQDEIGRLQENFRQMQHSLSSRIRELEQLTTTLEERGDGLRAAYNRARKADGMKTAFLHNMTDQMLAPAEAICRNVETLSNGDADMQEAAEDIPRQGKTITRLLDHLINISDEEPGEGGLTA